MPRALRKSIGKPIFSTERRKQNWKRNFVQFVRNSARREDNSMKHLVIKQILQKKTV
jgi:hypothetical protein